MSLQPDHVGIYANALPYFPDRVDLYDLDRDGEDTALALWEQTLRGELSMSLRLSPVVAGTFRQLYFQTRNHALTYGARSLALGYPTLICPQGADLIAAPLLLFEWQLEPSRNRPDTWLVQHNHRHRVRVNTWLVAHLEARTQRDLSKLFARTARRPDAAQLQRLCDAVADLLDITDRADVSYPVAFPDVERLGQLDPKGTILACGTVGQFVPRRFAAAPDPAAWIPAEATPGPDRHALAPFPLDPEQTSATRLAIAQRLSLVEGGKRSGKDGVATWLLLNAAANGESTLVVSDSIPALRRLQGRLTAADFTDGQYLLRDPGDDLPQLLQIYRAVSERRSGDYQPTAAYTRVLRETTQLQRQLDATYGALRQPVFGEQTWTEAVGALLAADRQEPKEQLATYLGDAEFQWTYEEAEALDAAVLRCEPLYRRLGTLAHPLGNLDDGIFLNRDAAEARQFIGKQLDRLSEEVALIERELVRAQERYVTDLRNWRYRLAERLEGQTDRWLEQLAERRADLGEGLLDEPGWWVRRTLRFRPRRRRLEQARTRLRESYAQWRTMHVDAHPFPIDLPSAGAVPLAQLETVTRAYQARLREWRRDIPTEAHRDALQLTPRQAFPALGYEAELTQLERRAQLFVDQLNAGGLYGSAAELRALTIPGIRAELLQLREQLAATYAQLTDFRAFYNWQANWLRQTPGARAVVRALVEAQPTDWRCALRSWYLYETLSRVDRRYLPESDELIPQLVAALDALAPLQREDWTARRGDLVQRRLRRLRQEQRRDYQVWLRDLDPLTAPVRRLIELAQRTQVAWRAAFPVLFVTPEVARTLFAGAAPFDQLLLLGGDRLDAIQTDDLPAFARRTVVFASTPNDKADSLSARLRAAATPLAVLASREHRVGADLPVPHLRVRVDEVGGRYYERRRTNEVEVQVIVQRLLEIDPTEDRRLPRVGVVVFTEAQRNLIAAHLLEMKQRNAPGSEKIAQLERNGLGLYTIDEIYGATFEVLLVALTFGELNRTGDFGRTLAFFDRPEATQHFNYLLHLDATELQLIHSLPRQLIDDYLHHSVDMGSYLLASFLNYYTARAAENFEEAQAYLANFADDDGAPRLTHQVGEEVGRALVDYLGKDRITLQDRVDGLPIDLTVAPRYPEEPGFCLQPDAFFAQTPHTDPHWELRKRKQIRGAGYEFLPVWTRRWWKDTAQAARKLAAKIIARDREYERV